MLARIAPALSATCQVQHCLGCCWAGPALCTSCCLHRTTYTSLGPHARLLPAPTDIICGLQRHLSFEFHWSSVAGGGAGWSGLELLSTASIVIRKIFRAFVCQEFRRNLRHGGLYCFAQDDMVCQLFTCWQHQVSWQKLHRGVLSVSQAGIHLSLASSTLQRASRPILCLW